MTRADFLKGVAAASVTGLLAARADPDAGAVLHFDAFRRSRPELDVVAALKAAVAELDRRGGGVLQLGPGVLALPSAALGRNGVSLPANIVLRGAGREATSLEVTGTDACNILRIVNASNVAVRNLALIGNGVSLGEASGAALTAFLLPFATADMENVAVESVALANFAAPYWVQIENDHGGTALEHLQAPLGSGSRTIRGVRLRDIQAESRPGNSLAPELVTVHAHVLRVSGFSGFVDDVVVDDLRVDAAHIKGGLSIGHRMRKVVVNRPVIVDAGRLGARDDAAAYAIELYDTYGHCRDVAINAPRITNPRSCGLYIAGGVDVTVADASVTGQTDRRYQTLPKGGIVFNGTVRATVSGGVLSGNAIDLHISAPVGAERRMDHRIRGLRTSGSGVRSLFISYAPVHAVTAGITVSDCDLRSDGCAVVVQCSRRYCIDEVVLERCAIATAATGNALAVDWYVDSGSASDNCGMRDCTVAGPVRVREVSGRFFAETIDARCSAPGGIASQFYRCSRLALAGCTGHDAGPGGAAFDLRESSGTVEGCRAVNCEVLSLGELGRVRPTHRGIPGDFVQNLAPATDRPGQAGYVVAGWRNVGGTTWVEERRQL